MLIRFYVFAVSLALVLASPSLSAAGFESFATHNQGPLVQIYGLPTLGSAQLLKTGQHQLDLNINGSNHFYNGNQGTQERLSLDGETHRAALVVRAGADRFEWGLEFPYVSHDGGFMDGFIENWHDTFNTPNGGRELTARNQLAYVYQRDGIDRLRFTQASRGVGDVRIYGAWPILAENSTFDIALRASAKLPTGNAQELRGSGAADWALWLISGCRPGACPGGVYWTVAAGALLVGRGDLLPELQERAVAFGSATLGFPILDSVILKTELLAHTPFYKSSLPPMGENTVQLILGGTWQVTRDSALEFGIAEDINVDSAPDVTFVVSFRTTFPR